MRHKARALLVLLCVVIIVSIGVFSNAMSKVENKKEEPGNEIKEIAAEIEDAADAIRSSGDITAIEAYEIAYPKAKEWIPEAKLIDISSTDAGGSPTIKSGMNGKRDAWYVYFGNEEATKTCHILVDKDGVADVHNMEESASSRGLFEISDIKVTFEEAYEIAVEQKGLQPGDPEHPEDWLIGYHYELRYATFQDDDKRLIATVTEISPNGNFAQVTIDQETEEILFAQEKIGYDEDGHSMWGDF
ncbi:MAG: hypothetical protein LBL49_07225 [Clostridiales Family XIII bacterium]|nr:hypothetical protein [Clostridiales Family XIII bacterium]